MCLMLRTESLEWGFSPWTKDKDFLIDKDKEESSDPVSKNSLIETPPKKRADGNEEEVEVEERNPFLKNDILNAFLL